MLPVSSWNLQINNVCVCDYVLRKVVRPDCSGVCDKKDGTMKASQAEVTMKASQEEVPPKVRQKLYPVGGVKVMFPVKPYPSQLLMMEKILKGLKHRQNCLVESPTGSGKSLALICSTLAWQRQQKEKAQIYNSLVDAGVTDPDELDRACGFTPLIRHSVPDASQQPSPTVPPSTPAPNPVPSNGGFFYEDDDDFKTWTSLSQSMPGDSGIAMEEPIASVPQNQNIPDRPRKLRVPKIFIGTRTHKQVEQIVKELHRTAYSNVNMVVLSSREHSCIHPVVSNSFSKNEKCRELTDPHKGISCSYYHGVNRIKTHDLLSIHGRIQGAWDIEDMVRVGHKINACPYFAARSLLDTAELVICPYNYLVDPLIRKSMKINLKNHVLILDEAHNIEESSKDAASRIVSQDDVKEAYTHLEERKTDIEECKKLASVLSALSDWIDENSNKLSDFTDFGKPGKIYTGTEMIAILDHLGIRSDNYNELENCFATVSDNQPDEENGIVSLNSVTKKVLDDFLLVLYFLFMDNMKNKDDYRVVLMKEQVRKKSSEKDGWFNKKFVLQFEYTLNFWCLNPAVAFSPISALTHSIILTSGTLSPMSSFQSELGVPFKIQLEANHVVDNNQIFVGAIGHGPQGKPLLATFQHTGTWEFQDELGEMVLNVCQTVPAGILCFLPSYAMLNKLHERWQQTGVWDEISKIKEAMTEQKKGEEFERDMTHFYTTIRNVQMEGSNDINGVFYMAVYRGKVSEGLDFTDDNARCVIAVGIPFPSIKDTQVNLKKKYNDKFHNSKKLLSGNDWYEIQGYRAINQALGRCIRHRYDWGALLLVDLRFQRADRTSSPHEHRYVRGLSKWVRTKVIQHKNCSAAINSLREFVTNMKTNPPQPPKMQESTSKEKTQSSPKAESNNCSQEVTVDSKLTASPGDFFISESTLAASLGMSISDELKENASQKECNTVESRQKIPGDQQKSEQRCGTDSCRSSKEDEKMIHQSRKRSHIAMDYEDLEDFNLTRSPSVREAHQPAINRKKDGQKKKGIIFIDLE